MVFFCEAGRRTHHMPLEEAVIGQVVRIILEACGEGWRWLWKRVRGARRGGEWSLLFLGRG